MGPIHLVVGAAGMDLSPDGAKIPPGWLRNRIDDYGIGLIKASKDTLEFQFISDDSENILDQFILHKRNQIPLIQDRIAVETA